MECCTIDQWLQRWAAPQHVTPLLNDGSGPNPDANLICANVRYNDFADEPACPLSAPILHPSAK
ncbi:hypothetical protein DYI23_15035 [Roseibium polysiphoniae]|uniref:Uncharacterized protein n=1 Tax=Roseibium polysiphoniae TaxID=2571221 RepID=A0A944CEU3_9HYPH|nr:hypothetical protein [Roseibium polysiphoniae]